MQTADAEEYDDLILISENSFCSQKGICCFGGWLVVTREALEIRLCAALLFPS